MNKQLCTEEDNPGRAPEHAKDASDAQMGAKTEGGRAEKHSKPFTGITHSPAWHTSASREVSLA